MDVVKIFNEGLKKQFDLPDWEVHEIPWMSHKLFLEFEELVGSSNLRVVSGSRKQVKHNGEMAQDLVRCTVLISPEGMERLKDAVRKSKSETQKSLG